MFVLCVLTDVEILCHISRNSQSVTQRTCAGRMSDMVMKFRTLTGDRVRNAYERKIYMNPYCKLIYILYRGRHRHNL
jgi:hypothetical protein